MSIDDKVLESGASPWEVPAELGLFMLASHVLTTAVSAASRYSMCKKERPDENPVRYYIHCYNRRFWKPKTFKISASIALATYAIYSVFKK